MKLYFMDGTKIEVMKSDWLTVQEAANIVGVSASTLKRMCESESIPIMRTPGGHRRIDKSDIDQVASRYMQAPHRNQKELGAPLHPTCEMVLQHLLDGQSMTIAKLLTRSSRSPLELIMQIEDCLIAALWKVGELWREQKLDVYQEHLCSDTALSALTTLRNTLRGEANPERIAVGGSFPPSIETIPSKLVALSLELVGYRAYDLGCSLPAESLAQAAKDLGANLVWVTHTHVTDVELLLNSHQELRKQLPPGIKIVVGGGGLSPAVRRSISWCKFYETLSQMVASKM